MDGGTVHRPAPGVVETELDGRVAAYAPATDQVVVLSDTATSLWRLLRAGPHTLDDLVRDLADQYRIAPGEIRADVAGALEQLETAGLLVPAARPDATRRR